MFKKGNQYAKGNPPNKTSFKKGLIPWHKNKTKKDFPQLSNWGAKKGTHNSPDTEFKKGQKAKNWNGFKKENKAINPWKKGQKSKNWNGFKKGQWTGKNHPNWQGGISFEPYSVDWTETLKRSIRERDNYICQKCSQYGNTVHHIDYDKKNCNPINLITLCHICNSKVNKNRNYWSAYFQKLMKLKQII